MKAKWITLTIIAALSFIGLVYFFGLGGAIAGVFESLLLFALSDIDKTTGYMASSYKLLRTVHFYFERNAVEKRLESTINLASRRVNEEGVNLLPHRIDIKWVEPEGRDAFLKDGKLVVCLESSFNEDRNLARATILFASEDFLRESQRFIDRDILKSACFALARKMLMFDRKLGALRCLNEEFIKIETLNNPRISDYITTMEKLDAEGCLTRVLLKELSEIDAKLPSVLSSPTAEAETVTFLQMMKQLAEKKKGVDINTSFRGQIIDMSIMLVAREGVIDPTPYISHAEKCWSNGLPRLYVMAQGNKIGIAKNAIIGIKAMGIYGVESEWCFRIPDERRSFDSYIVALSRIHK
ncbi:hypothetical protein MUP01_12610 [Candidatus Bathyarchaeota archaeon]|nr:hypothetical protein [Candidatus Bathyarchaeota archaeon]